MMCGTCQVELPSANNPTKCYLDFLTLPNDDSTQIDLRQVATVTLSHLDRLAQPYIASEKVGDMVPDLLQFGAPHSFTAATRCSGSATNIKRFSLG